MWIGYVWAKSQAISLRIAVKKTATQIFSVCYAVYSSPLIRKWSYDNLLQFWEGFSRIFNPSIVSALLRSKDSRRVLRQSLPANLVFYMGLVLTYEALVKRTLREMIPDMKGSSTEQALDFVTTFSFMHVAMSRFFDNTFYNLCISEASKNASKTIVPPCSCGTTAMIKANLASPLYYLGNIIPGIFILPFLPFGSYLAFLLLSLAYGRNFVEYKLGAAGLCTTHRYKELIKNNSFCMGFGVSFEMMHRFLNYTVYKSTHVENDFFIDDALFCCLFQYYIMLAHLIDKPLPGDKPGIDILYPNRLMTKLALQKMCDFMIPRLRNPKTRGQLEEILQEINMFPPVNLIKIIFLEKSLRSWEAFIQRSSTKLFFDTYGEHIQEGIQKIREVRAMSPIRQSPLLIRLLLPYLPDFLISRELKDLLRLLFAKKLDEILNRIDGIVDRAGIEVTIYDPKRMNAISLESNDVSSPKPAIKSSPTELSQDDFG